MRSIMAKNVVFFVFFFFSIWRPPPSWILSYTTSEGKSCPGTLFSVSVSDLVQIRSKISELWRFNWFQNGGRRHLGFCTMWILAVSLTVGPHFQPMFQIRCKCTQKWPSYGQKCDFQYGGRRHLGFVGYEFWGQRQSRDLILDVCIKFGANPFKNGGVMTV